VTFSATKLYESDTALKSALLIAGGLAVGIRLYRQRRNEREGRHSKLKIEHTLCLYTVIFSLGMPYIACMSGLLADVQITTDREFYTQTDPVIFTVRRGGYLFQPAVTKITLGTFERSDDSPGGMITSRVAPEMRGDSNLIIVEFKPQIFGQTRKAANQYRETPQDPAIGTLPGDNETVRPGVPWAM
jgi:hypothetical protein